MTLSGPPRRSGIEVVGSAPWGTHFCQFYQTEQDLVDTLVPYFKAGLEDNEFCMWVTAEPLSAEAAERALRGAVPDLDRYLQTGQIEIIPYSDWYLLNGGFDSERVLKGWVRKLESAQAKGFAGLRLTGNTFWLEKKDWRDFTDYEAAINDVVGFYPMIALCTYCLDRCDGHEVIDVIRNHQYALIKRDGQWDMIESTERKRLGEALVASEERYRMLFEHLCEGFAVHEMVYDERGTPVDYRFLELNPAFEALTGLDRERVIGRTVREVIPGLESFWIERYAEVVATGVPAHFEQRAEPLGRHYEVVAYSPSPGRFATLFFDVTERKRVEDERERLLAQVRVRAAELDAILDSVSDGLVVYGPNAEIVRMNEPAERILGCGREEWTSLSPAERLARMRPRTPEGRLLSPEEIPLARALHGQTMVAWHLVFDRPGGERVHVLSNTGPIRAEDGRILGAVANFTDFSELHAAQERREDFLRMISHDLRQPLTVILGQAQLVARRLEEQGAGERSRRGVEAINSSAKRMQRMISDLVDSARLEAGEVSLQMEPTDPYLLLTGVAESALGPEAAARVRVEMDDWVPPVLVDPERIERVLTNLLGNALKYSPPEEAVVVRARQRDNVAVFSVSDRGSGIDPEELPHLFGRYYRARSAQTREGLGLGLYISRLIVEAHGGQIWCESEVGRGSTFSFSLPLAT